MSLRTRGSLHASRLACALDGARTPPVQSRSSSCPQAPPTTIKTKTRGVTWMVNRILELLEFKNQASQCFAGNQRCPGVWNSFPFLAWDLSMQPRTHILFFNEFICTGACACSSILNYAQNALKTHLMHKNVQTNPKNSQKFTQHSYCSMLTREKNWKQ